MIHILIGKPGSGKGTQAQLLKKRLGYKVVTMGDLLREAALTNQTIKDIQSRGDLVPEQTCMDLLREVLSDIIFSNKPIILDGFPRNMGQASKLNANVIGSVIFLDIPDSEMESRLNNRSRSDDNKVTIKRRLELWYSETSKVVEYYKDLIIHVDADNDPEQIFEEVARSIKLHY